MPRRARLCARWLSAASLVAFFFSLAKTRNAALFVPIEAGRGRVDLTTPLPAMLSGEGIVVVSGITTKKTDAPFTLSFATPPAASAPLEAKDSGGCAVSRRKSGSLGALPWLAALAWLVARRRPLRC